MVPAILSQECGIMSTCTIKFNDNNIITPAHHGSIIELVSEVVPKLNWAYVSPDERVDGFSPSILEEASTGSCSPGTCRLQLVALIESYIDRSRERRTQIRAIGRGWYQTRRSSTVMNCLLDAGTENCQSRA